jgi:acetate kinase
MRNLRSVDTTMGFSTLEGIVMGARPGALDPGIMLYLMRAKRWSADQIERFLYHECGLKAVSGMTGDVEVLLRSTNPRAREALDLFAFSVARHTAAVASTLGGLNRFIFTGGIGEHASPVRAMIGDRLAWLGVELNGEANDDNRREIAAANSRVRVQVLATDEEAVIARATAVLVPGPTAMAAGPSSEHR